MCVCSQMIGLSTSVFFSMVSFIFLRKVQPGEQGKDNFSSGSKISHEFSANPLID